MFSKNIWIIILFILINDWEKNNTLLFNFVYIYYFKAFIIIKVYKNYFILSDSKSFAKFRSDMLLKIFFSYRADLIIVTIPVINV